MKTQRLSVTNTDQYALAIGRVFIKEKTKGIYAYNAFVVL